MKTVESGKNDSLYRSIFVKCVYLLSHVIVLSCYHTKSNGQAPELTGGRNDEKFLAMALAAVMVLALAACGSKNDTADDTGDAQDAQGGETQS